MKSFSSLGSGLSTFRTTERVFPSNPQKQFERDMLEQEPIYQYLFRQDIATLQLASLLCNCGRQAIGVGQMYLNNVVSTERTRDLDGAIPSLQDAVRIGSSVSLRKLFRGDPATWLNVMRKVLKRDRALMDKIRKHKIPDLPPETACDLIVGFADGLIVFLETRISEIRLDSDLDRLGLGSDGKSPLPNMPAATTATRPFLLTWGSIVVRHGVGARLLLTHEGIDANQRDVATTIVDECLERLVELEPEGGILRSEHGSVLGRHLLLAAADWALSGYPTLQPSHKLAASLMATSIPEELVPEIVVPWDSFFVELPSGLLPSMEWASLVGVMVSRMRSTGEFQIGFYPDVPRPVHYTIPTLKVLANFGPVARKDAVCTEELARAFEVMARLTLGTLIELDQKQHKEAIARGAPSSCSPSTPRKPGILPSQWTFQLKRDVVVDVRSYVHDYVSHGKGALTVQRLVRGHQKRQPYGPKGSLRKWIHIEPYWQGSPEAPIALRSHRVGERR